MLIGAFNIPVAFAQSTMIIVPEDFSTIQEAVGAANPGDTIYVRAGTYLETVTIFKNNLVLTGENKATTILDGSGDTYPIVSIYSADNVEITGFTIQNSNDGIYIYNSSDVTVSGNTITNCASRGIILACCSSNTISGNTLTNNYDGIELWKSSNCIVSENTITNSRFGIGMSDSSGNTFSGNMLTDSKDGFYIWNCSYTTVSGNSITESANNGISLIRSSDCKLSGNSITDSAARGICLSNSSNSIVSGNNVTDSTMQGILLSSSSSNTISENTLTSNSAAVQLYRSSYVTVSGNIITSNRVGFGLSQSSDNTFYHNDIIGNTYLISIVNSSNIWDDGYPSGGNYWSTYVGIDSDEDGIGDTPYVFDENNQDNYPLMKPYNANLPSSYTLVVHTIPIGVTFTAGNISCVGPWSETYNETTSVTLTMPESHSYEGKHYAWTGWDDGNTDRTRTVNVNKYTVLTAIFTQEYEPPVFSVLSPENKTYSITDVPLEYTVNSDFYTITYSVDGQENVKIVDNTTLSGLADGVHELTVTVNFRDSNIIESATVWFTVDTTLPSITDITQLPVNVNGTMEDGVKINATVTDAISGVNQVVLNYTVDNETWVIAEMAKLEGDIWTGTIPESPHGTNVTYTIIAEDMVGNTIRSEDLFGQPNQYQVLPEFTSWIILPLFLTVTLIATILRKKQPKKPKHQSNQIV